MESSIRDKEEKKLQQAKDTVKLITWKTSMNPNWEVEGKDTNIDGKVEKLISQFMDKQRIISFN